jgi:hypothetical protein
MAKIKKGKGSKHRQYNGQNKESQKDRSTDNTMAKKKERQKDRSTDNTMAKIKKGKRNEAQTMQWPK